MSEQTTQKIMIGSLTFFLGGLSAMIAVYLMMSNARENEVAHEEATEAPEIAQPQFGLPNYVRQEDAKLIEIRVPEGDLGELAITQELLDQLLAEQSCDVFENNPGSYSLYPWSVDSDVECKVYHQGFGSGAKLVISLLGLHGSFEGSANISDAIIVIQNGQPFIYEDVHMLAQWKEAILVREISENYPDAAFPNDAWVLANDEYTEALRAYIAEPDGEIAWARNDLTRIIEVSQRYELADE